MNDLSTRRGIAHGSTDCVPGTFTIGMLGPILLAEFRAFLDPSTIPPDAPPGTGGSPVNLLGNELLRRGHRLVLFTCDPRALREIVVSGPALKICIVPQARKPARSFFAREIEHLRQAVERERPDVLHAQWTYEFALAALSAGIPHVVTAHDAPLNVLRLNFIPYRLARTVMAWRACRRAHRLVAVSPYVAHHLRRFCFHRRPITVIANGMPESLFQKTRVRRADPTAPTFATVLVGWGGRKNGQRAIEAFARVRTRLPGARLIMFGDGHGPGQAAEAYAHARGVEPGIDFAGHVPYAVLHERLAREVDVLVHPALEEAHPMALIEAMALGIPVIGGKAAGGVPWTLDEGRAGILVDVRSTGEVADAMLLLGQNRDEARAVGTAGRAVALERFHIRAVADAYERIYADLLAQRG